MKIKTTTWLIFLIAALLSLLVWLRFSYPQFSILDLSLNKAAALDLAKEYLKNERGVDVSKFETAIIFGSDSAADRYLQKTILFEGEKEFIREHDVSLFFWVVRFFQENKKEEYRVVLDSATGQVISFRHTIEDTEARSAIDEAQAKERAIDFLKKSFGFDPENYTINSDLSKSYDNRTDYTFNWQKKGVYVPWQHEGVLSGAKLLTGVVVSGDEVLSFHKTRLDIPDEFSRFIEKQKNTGYLLSLVFKLIYIVLLTSATYFVIVRRNDLAMHTAKKFCIILTAFLFFLNIAASLNEFQTVLFNFPTTSSLPEYIGRYSLELLIGTFFLTITILMPSLSGESLYHEMFPKRREGSLIHYLTSTFFSRRILKGVLLGYLVCAIMLGIQSLAFEAGYRYLGVWTEKNWMTEASSTYFPFFAAFVVGFQASLVEEITFRIFAISWIKKLLKSTLVACILASLIWGFGHSNYPVFPMWFRGIEVTCLGLFLSFVFLRFGILPVVVAHYTFDVFWSNANYLIGKSHPLYFYSSLAVILIPLAWGIIAFILNRPDEQKPLRWRLNKHQLFNLNLIKNYIREQGAHGKTQEEIKNELIGHGWDVAVIETAMEGETQEN